MVRREEWDALPLAVRGEGVGSSSGGGEGSGWRTIGTTFSKAEASAYVELCWTDQTPKSHRDILRRERCCGYDKMSEEECAYPKQRTRAGGVRTRASWQPRPPVAFLCSRHRYEALSVPLSYEAWMAYKKAERSKLESTRAARVAADAEAARNATADTTASAH